MNYRIYPSITTTNKDWPLRIKEAQNLGLSTLCFFPTCLKESERKKAYRLLIEAGIKKLPFVHLRHDFPSEEIDFLSDTFGTHLFNEHSKNSMYPPLNRHFRYRDRIYIENTDVDLTSKELKGYAGICLDVSHLEERRIIKDPLYENWMEILGGYKTGVSHVSAIKSKPVISKTSGNSIYSSHRFSDLSEFDYVTRYKKYLPEVIALELENTLEEQLKVQEYLESVLG